MWPDELAPEDLKTWKDTLKGRTPVRQASLLKVLPPGQIAAILRELEVDEREEILAALPSRLSEEIKKRWAEEVHIPQELLDDILKGECVLFLGAGISMESGMPSSGQLVSALGEDPGRVGLPEAAGRYERAQGRRALGKRIKEEFDNARRFWRPGSLHFIANIEPLTSLIVTTNWDTLLEEALKAEGITPLVIRQPEELTLMASADHVLVKLHGDINEPLSLIITERDYALKRKEWLEPVGFGALLSNLITTKTLIFVGYSMTDENFRLMWDILKAKMVDRAGRRVGRKHYVVVPWEEREASFVERTEGVEVVKSKARAFFEELFRQLSDFVNRKEEIRQICYVIPQPFIEVWGNAGCGKTKLLQGVGREYRLRKGFSPIIYIDFRDGITEQNLFRWLAAGAKGFKLDGSSEEGFIQGVKNRAVLFLVDSLEDAEKAARRRLEELLRRLASLEKNGVGKYRAVFASRYPLFWSPSIRVKLAPINLTPFREEAVEEMVRKYFYLYRNKGVISPSDRKKLARRILDIVGTGHAKLIKDFLDNLMVEHTEGELPSVVEMISYINGNELILAERAIKLLKKEKLTGADFQIVRILENGFCVIRQFNLSVLRSLHGKGLGSEELFEEPHKLLRALENLHIVIPPSAERLMYELDPVIRYAFSKWLELKDPDGFYRVHLVADEIYKSGVPETVDSTQLAYIVESLYHYTFEAPPAEEFKEQLEDYLTQLQSVPPGEERRSALQLRDMLFKDEELRGWLEKLGEKDYSQIIEFLEEYIDKAGGA
jgi:hypothetical protein